MRQLMMDRLEALRLRGMRQALILQKEDPRWCEFEFEDRLGNLLEAEEQDRADRRLEGRLKRARLGHHSRMEELDYKTNRTFDRALLQSLAACRWIKERHNAVLSGPTGVGKTFLAGALAHRACQEGFTVRFYRLSRMLTDLTTARADGTHGHKLLALSRIDLLVLDDWLVTPLTDLQRRDLLEVFEDRYRRKSTLVAAQLPPEHWHEAIGEPTLADAILDRIVHNAYHLRIQGESMRKARGLGAEFSTGGTLDPTT